MLQRIASILQAHKLKPILLLCIAVLGTTLLLLSITLSSSKPNSSSTLSSASPAANKGKKKYITYSLYSKDGISPPDFKFTFGIWNNIKLAQEVFPDWTVLIYLPDTMDKNFVNLMKDAPNVEIKEMPFDLETAMMWRFLAADYDHVERFIVRDLDSGFQWREKRAVDDWVKRDVEMHVIRDGSCHHTYPMMGGMWGAKGGFVKRFMNTTMAEIVGNYKPNSTYNEDQNLLRDIIWPEFKDKAVCHDVVPGKMDWNRPYPTLAIPGGNWDRFPHDVPYCRGMYFIGNYMPYGRTYDCQWGPDVQCQQDVYRSFHLNYMLATGIKKLDIKKMQILDSMMDVTKR